MAGAFSTPQVAPGSNACNFGDIVVGPTGQVMVTYQNNIPTQGPSTIFVNISGQLLSDPDLYAA